MPLLLSPAACRHEKLMKILGITTHVRQQLARLPAQANHHRT
jgi:hypothetical protein